MNEAGKGYHGGRPVDPRKWDEAEYWKNLERRRKAAKKKGGKK